MGISIRPALWVILPVFFIAGSAQATLGEKIQPAHPGALFSGAESKISEASGYATYEGRSGKSTVKEFVDSKGVVFAASWNGSHHPDLQKLLGKHFSSYKSALAQTPRSRGRAAVEVRNEDIVVRVGGHMGGVHGFAYLPALVPDGVSTEDLK